MADLSVIVLVLIIGLDFVLSLWNAYASGLTWTLLRHQPGQRFAKACAIAGLGLAFAGMSYVMLIVISYVALVLSIIALGDFLFVLAFDFLVFGAMIIGFGLVVTAQSIAIAYRERNFGAIAVSAWNVFAEILDISIYAEGFRDAAGVVSGGRERINLYAIIAVALGLAFLITYVAYRHGVRRAEGAIMESPQQSAAESGAPIGSPSGRHRIPRSTVIIAVVVALILVAAAVAYVSSRALGVKVHVTAIDVWAPDNVCGFGSQLVGYNGFDDSPGASDAFALQIHNFNSTSCTIHGATTNTSGFGLSNVQVPVTVAGMQNGTLSLVVLLPNGGFDGPLNLVYS